MNIALPKTIEEWTEKKRQFMKLLQRTDDPRMAQDYENAINFCDRGVIGIHKREALEERIEQVKTKARHRVKCMFIAISIAVILSIVSIGLFGCIENTMRGAGNAVQGIGKLVTGVGTDVVRGVDGYSQEK